jgi:hypothetical protein
LARWDSTVLWLRKSCDATSRLLAPAATSRAMRSSWGVSSSSRLASRLRAVSPVA